MDAGQVVGPGGAWIVDWGGGRNRARGTVERLVSDQQEFVDEFLRAVRGWMRMAVLAACYWLIDVRGWKRWAQPFVWFGANPLAIYLPGDWLGKASVKHHIGGERWKTKVYDGIFADLFASPYLNSLAFAACYVLLFWLIAWVLYGSARYFIRV